MSDLQFICNQVAATRRETKNGREFLVVSVIAYVEGVLNGEFVPGEEIGRHFLAWNGRPFVIGHPPADNGNAGSANDPETLERIGLGTLYNTTWTDHKLRTEAWIDLELAAAKGGDHVVAVERLEAGELTDVSTAYWRDPVEASGSFEGEQFATIASNIVPDHLALLLDESGACSIDDGCGAPRLNQAKGPGPGWWGPPKGSHGSGSIGGRKFESASEANGWLSSSGGINPDLESTEIAALSSYKGDSFLQINAAFVFNQELRDGGSTTSDADVVIDGAFGKSRLEEPITVHRGVSFDVFEDEDDMTGFSVSDNAYVSATLLKSKAEQFSDGIVIEIRVPEGTPAINMERWQLAQGSEFEVLLPRELNFDVLSDTGVDSDPREMVWEVAA